MLADTLDKAPRKIVMDTVKNTILVGSKCLLSILCYSVIEVKSLVVRSSEAVFKIRLTTFLDTLILKIILLIIKKIKSPGEVSDISALKKSFTGAFTLYKEQCFLYSRNID